MPTARVQVGPRNAHHSAMAQLAAEALSEPAYNTLRAQEQLGYGVHVFAHELGAVVGVAVCVTSSLPAPAVAERVRAFLLQYEHGALAKMKPKALEALADNAAQGMVRPSAPPPSRALGPRSVTYMAHHGLAATPRQGHGRERHKVVTRPALAPV